MVFLCCFVLFRAVLLSTFCCSAFTESIEFKFMFAYYNLHTFTCSHTCFRLLYVNVILEFRMSRSFDNAQQNPSFFISKLEFALNIGMKLALSIFNIHHHLHGCFRHKNCFYVFYKYFHIFIETDVTIWWNSQAKSPAVQI